jgi:hypothetical protein
MVSGVSAERSPEGLGLAALVPIGIGGMVGGGIFSVLGLTVQIAGAGAYLSFVVGGVVVASLTGWSYGVRGPDYLALEPALQAQLLRHARPGRRRLVDGAGGGDDGCDGDRAR